MKTLYEMFLNGQPRKSQKWHHYFPIYEWHFARFRDKSPTVVEIGVAGGGSLMNWREYFGPSARIVGVDINPVCKDLEKEGFEIHIGDQTDDAFMDELAKAIEGADIVIDDGGHTSRQTINTFEKLFPAIQKEGVYLVEDVCTSFWPSYVDRWDGMTFLDLAKTIAEKLSWWHIIPANRRYKQPPEEREGEVNVPWIARNLWSVSFYNAVVVFEKRVIEEPWNDRR